MTVNPVRMALTLLVAARTAVRVALRV